MTQSGYETHALSSILIWLEDEWASIYSTNKKLRINSITLRLGYEADLNLQKITQQCV